MPNRVLLSSGTGGNQKYTGDLSALKYGVSITDECISWETTEKLLLDTHEKLMAAGLHA